MSEYFTEGWLNGVDYDSMIEESCGHVALVHGRIIESWTCCICLWKDDESCGHVHWFIEE